jgi:hypothetical protein
VSTSRNLYGVTHRNVTLDDVMLAWLQGNRPVAEIGKSSAEKPRMLIRELQPGGTTALLDHDWSTVRILPVVAKVSKERIVGTRKVNPLGGVRRVNSLAFVPVGDSAPVRRPSNVSCVSSPSSHR